MPHESNKPFDESNLESPEYRERLMRKLNCLIAVLEVANAKVKKSLTGPAPDVERLTRIRTNLTSTLEVCRRARRALERREALPEGLPENLAQVVRSSEITPLPARKGESLPRGANVEMSSPAEHKRFVDMGRISPKEISSCDFDALAKELQR
ncbi:MAG: hypothetical protein GY711_31410 [bacterium]|nr:hypothetical protein [bacterium]